MPLYWHESERCRGSIGGEDNRFTKKIVPQACRDLGVDSLSDQSEPLPLNGANASTSGPLIGSTVLAVRPEAFSALGWQRQWWLEASQQVQKSRLIGQR
jgi:hypothetical protein